MYILKITNKYVDLLHGVQKNMHNNVMSPISMNVVLLILPFKKA